jgi:single-strand DNA-binding protein
LRYLTSGTAVCDIGLAVNDRRKNQAGEWVEETTFVDVTLWGRTAENVAQYLRKGAGILIEGRLKYESWEKDGQKRSKLKVIGEKAQFIGGKRDASSGPGQSGPGSGGNGHGAPPTYADLAPAGAPAGIPADGPADDGEIPF